MKMRNKGRVYPSPSPSSTPSSTSNRDALSVLNLLPAAILALISVLSTEDREVLAYMISWSLNSTKISKKLSNKHKPPVFDCECFECYTSFWFKWDSSPSRELIHEAIEAFEEHLASGEKKRNSRGKKRDKMGRRAAEKPADVSETPAPEYDAPPEEGSAGDGEGVMEEAGEEEEAPPEEEVVVRSSVADNHKTLARKVLPDVVGLFNSRLWSLWSPNV